MKIHGEYRDGRGSEQIGFETDGTSLKTQIRGVVFEGVDFDGLTSSEQSELFTYWQGDLCECKLILDVPIRLVTPEGLRQTVMKAEVGLGSPGAKGGLDEVSVSASLTEPEFSIQSPGDSGWFEDELLSLSNALPAGFGIQACITCGLSDYSPYGHGTFGSMACFRDAAEDYRQVGSKEDIFALWNRLTEYVQETHYCDQFEERPKGRGYRG